MHHLDYIGILSSGDTNHFYNGILLNKETDITIELLFAISLLFEEFFEVAFDSISDYDPKFNLVETYLSGFTKTAFIGLIKDLRKKVKRKTSLTDVFTTKIADESALDAIYEHFKFLDLNHYGYSVLESRIGIWETFQLIKSRQITLTKFKMDEEMTSAKKEVSKDTLNDYSIATNTDRKRTIESDEVLKNAYLEAQTPVRTITKNRDKIKEEHVNLFKYVAEPKFGKVIERHEFQIEKMFDEEVQPKVDLIEHAEEEKRLGLSEIELDFQLERFKLAIEDEEIEDEEGFVDETFPTELYMSDASTSSWTPAKKNVKVNKKKVVAPKRKKRLNVTKYVLPPAKITTSTTTDEDTDSDSSEIGYSSTSTMTMTKKEETGISMKELELDLNDDDKFGDVFNEFLNM